jgi:hypothetical protein
MTDLTEARCGNALPIDVWAGMSISGTTRTPRSCAYVTRDFISAGE